MKSYFVSFRLGPAVDLARHNLTISANSISEATAIVDRKLYLRFPNYRLVSIQPMVELPIEETVEGWRDRA